MSVLEHFDSETLAMSSKEERMHNIDRFLLGGDDAMLELQSPVVFDAEEEVLERKESDLEE